MIDVDLKCNWNGLMHPGCDAIKSMRTLARRTRGGVRMFQDQKSRVICETSDDDALSSSTAPLH